MNIKERGRHTSVLANLNVVTILFVLTSPGMGRDPMELPRLGTLPELDSIMLQARESGIESNLLDLAMYGFTVIPPDKLGAGDLTERLRTATLGVYRRRSGHVIDDWASFDDKLENYQTWGWMLEDEAFLEAIHNPVFQTVGRFLTGHSGFIAGASMILKTRTSQFDLPLHTDSHGIPPPWPGFATYANLSWLLTDYAGEEDGPTVLVPASHRGRMPRPDESMAHIDGHPGVKAVPLKGSAGSLAVWNGAVWHGSVPRTRAGLRMTLVHVWQRVFMRPIEQPKEIAAELLKRYPDLPRLLGYDRMYPYAEQIERPERIEPTVQAGRDQYA